METQQWDKFWKNGKYSQIPSWYVVRLVSILNRRNAKIVLDLGCGAGRHLVYLAQKGFFVVGQDITSEGLEMAQKRLYAEKLNNSILVNHDVTELPFPDKSFDAVISTNALHHNMLKDINRAVDEIHRVLRDKGVLFVSLTSDKQHYRAQKRLEEGTYLGVRGLEKGVIHHLFTRAEINDTFRRFRIIRLTPPTKTEKHWLLLAEKR
jgi:ubiquinone/menaquinone biosynthesis C-methylase UbiE